MKRMGIEDGQKLLRKKYSYSKTSTNASRFYLLEQKYQRDINTSSYYGHLM